MSSLSLGESPRVLAILLCGLAAGSIAACHPRPSIAVPRPSTETVRTDAQSGDRARARVQSAAVGINRQAGPLRIEDVLAALPGVTVLRTPGGGVSVRIRGAGQLSAQEPLYVVDGLAVETVPGARLDWINPRDIARIEVLKDAAETSMYGGRGANGVIVIVTKHNR
jgi:TonB-dependent SusC/RagA subfamily outer membrane receptor